MTPARAPSHSQWLESSRLRRQTRGTETRPPQCSRHDHGVASRAVCCAETRTGAAKCEGEEKDTFTRLAVSQSASRARLCLGALRASAPTEPGSKPGDDADPRRQGPARNEAEARGGGS